MHYLLLLPRNIKRRLAVPRLGLCVLIAIVTSFCVSFVQYHANQFMPLSDDAIVRKVQSYLATCIPEFGTAVVTESAVVRVRRAVTHFSPGETRFDGW
jgi:hypothetical protein